MTGINDPSSPKIAEHEKDKAIDLGRYCQTNLGITPRVRYDAEKKTWGVFFDMKDVDAITNKLTGRTEKPAYQDEPSREDQNECPEDCECRTLTFAERITAQNTASSRLESLGNLLASLSESKVARPGTMLLVENLICEEVQSIFQMEYGHEPYNPNKKTDDDNLEALA